MQGFTRLDLAQPVWHFHCLHRHTQYLSLSISGWTLVASAELETSHDHPVILFLGTEQTQSYFCSFRFRTILCFDSCLSVLSLEHHNYTIFWMFYCVTTYSHMALCIDLWCSYTHLWPHTVIWPQRQPKVISQWCHHKFELMQTNQKDYSL